MRIQSADALSSLDFLLMKHFLSSGATKFRIGHLRQGKPTDWTHQDVVPTSRVGVRVRVRVRVRCVSASQSSVRCGIS